MTDTRWRLVLVGQPLLRRAAPAIEEASAEPSASIELVRKDAALLAYVAVNGTVASQRAASLVWAAAGERGALNNMRQRLHRLRKASGGRLLEAGDTLSLSSDLICTVDPSPAELEDDPAAWDGDFLAGFDYDDAGELAAWVAAMRVAWRERRREALSAVASSAEQRGELARAMGYSRRLLLDDPLSEHAHRRLMRLHYLRGDTAAAVAAFEACERSLKDELGLAPSAETLALLTTIESSTLVLETTRIRPVPASLLKPPRTVGRAEQQRRIAEGLHEGGIVVLVGEAGIGKTRLLQDALASAELGAASLSAQARPGDAGVPFGTLQRLCRAAMPAGSESLDRPTRAVDIEAVLHAAVMRGVTTFVLDDLHFADRASIETVLALVGNDRLRAARWLFAHRVVDAGEPDAALLRSLADTKGAHWISVPPLAEADLADLVDSLQLDDAAPAALAAALWRHTGGNPLYALETLRAARGAGAAPGPLTLPRPENIARMIDRRLQRLSERALALGRIAALAVPDFTPELAEHALATPAILLAGAWAELEAADVLRGNAFAHDLVRDAMLRSVPRTIAVHAHRQIAQFLQRVGAEPARVAPHWLQAGDGQAAGRAFQQAAERAALASRPREQAQLLLQAAECFDGAGERLSAIAARGAAITPMIRSDSLTDALALSQRLVDTEGDGPLGGQLWAMHAHVLCWWSRAVDAERAGLQALARLSESDDDAVHRMLATRSIAMGQGMQGRQVEALGLLRPWMARLDEVGTLDDRVGFCNAYAMVLMLANRPGDAIAVAARQFALATQAGDKADQIDALMSMAVLQTRCGLLDAAIDSGQRASGLGRGDAQLQATVTRSDIVLGVALCAAGQYAEGLARLDAARAEAASSGQGSNFQAMAEVVQAEALWRLGQSARALQTIAADHAGLSTSSAMKRELLRALIGGATVAKRRESMRQALAMQAGGDGVYQRLVIEIE